MYRKFGGSIEFNNKTWLAFCQYVEWKFDSTWFDYDEFDFELRRVGQLPILAIAGNTPRFTVFFWSRLAIFAEKLLEK